MRGRIRSIKPEVLTDEKLWDAEQASGMPLYRLFTGLWMYADRQGRFEWRPRALKAVILPYWDGDFAVALNLMAAAGFLLKYEVDGQTYGAVRTFLEHQTPNPKENPSKLPPPPEPTEIVTRENPDSPRVQIQSSHASPSAPEPEPVQKVSSGNGLGTDWERKGTEWEPRADAHEDPQPAAPELERIAPPYEPPSGVVQVGSALAGVLRGLAVQPKAPPLKVVHVEPEPDDKWTAEDQVAVFRREFERFQQTIANVGGKNVARFHADVVATARLQGRKPRELFTTKCIEWLERGLTDDARGFPYAFFQAEWGKLTAQGATRSDDEHGETAEQLAKLALEEAKANGQSAKYRELMDRANVARRRERKE
jgi:hypothetical protein